MSLAEKIKFDEEGFLILKTNFSNQETFQNISKNVYDDLNSELKKNYIQKFPGYIMGNLNVYPGLYGHQIFELLKKSNILKSIELILGNKIDNYKIEFGGNLSLPKKGKQLFHIDGKFSQSMTLISIATEKINLNNGPTEVCAGTHKRNYKFWQFILKKKRKIKLFLNEGDIIIRKHNLWHRGTKNYSNKARLLLSLILTPKTEDKKFDKDINQKLKIAPNFFKNNFYFRFYEFIYTKFGFLIVLTKFILSILKIK